MSALELVQELLAKLNDNSSKIDHKTNNDPPQASDNTANNLLKPPSITDFDDPDDDTDYVKKPNELYCMSRKLSAIRLLINDHDTDDVKTDTLIKNIVLIVVVDAEIRPIMDKYKFQKNDLLTKKLLNLGVVSSGKVKNLNIDIVKVADSKVFKRHYSGYTQSSAIAAMVSSVMKPDIVINFGTSGGITMKSKSQYNLEHLHTKQPSSDGHNHDINSDYVDTVKIGDVILGEACLFLDRLRTRNKNAFDWGLWGGTSLKTNNLAKDLGLVKGVLGSQIGYMVTEFQSQLIGNANIVALDMECAPIAQILNQTDVNFIALKVISNGVYPGNPSLMESEYHQNRETVSEKATIILVKLIDYLNNKTISQL